MLRSGYLYGRDQFSLVWTNAPVGDYALTAMTTNHPNAPANPQHFYRAWPEADPPSL